MIVFSTIFASSRMMNIVETVLVLVLIAAVVGWAIFVGKAL